MSLGTHNEVEVLPGQVCIINHNVIFISHSLILYIVEEQKSYKVFINMIYMVVVVSKHFIGTYFPHKENPKPLGVQVREATVEVVEKAVEVEVEVVVSQYRANFPCLSFGSVFSDGSRLEASSTLNILF